MQHQSDKSFYKDLYKAFLDNRLDDVLVGIGTSPSILAEFTLYIIEIHGKDAARTFLNRIKTHLPY